MNNYEAKKFDKHIHEYMLRFKNVKDCIDNLVVLIEQNKEIHPPHKLLMLDLLKEICNDVILGNQHLVSSFDSVYALVDNMNEVIKEL